MSRMFRLLVLAAAFTPHSAHAWQRTPPTSTARLGELVRVRTTAQPSRQGTLAYANRDSIIVSDGSGARWVVPTSTLVQLAARRRMPVRARMWRGALVGAAVATSIAILSELGSDRERGREGLPFLFVIFPVPGAGIGALLPLRAWERVTLPVP